jgi:hypothetical protein
MQSMKEIDLQNNPIISLYTSDIFIDCDFLTIIDKSIDEELQDITFGEYYGISCTKFCFW